MAGTFSQIQVQVVFAVKRRENLLQKPWCDEVYKYMSGVVKAKNQKPIIVNGFSDHVHLLIGLRPSMALSDLVRDVKNNSSKFINDNKFIRGKFSWQEGYGAFSYSQSQIKRVYHYILNQEKHHGARPFKAEYTDFLRKFDVPFDPQYLFDRDEG